MKIEGFEPIFGEPKAEWADSRSDSLGRFLFHVSAPDSSHLLIQVTDFRSNTWEAKRSVLQLDDMRDEIGIGGSWSEFIDYVVASIKSEDVKLILEGHSNADGAAYAKIVAQKSKGMPRISISLTRLTGSAATEAMAKLSLELFTAFRSMQTLIVQEQERCLQLEKEAAAEKERNENIQNQPLYSKRQKLQKMNFSDKTDISASILSNGSQDSPGVCGLHFCMKWKLAWFNSSCLGIFRIEVS
ncbi:hypothetical protein CISIN_1g0254382mg [Citrus sinensis]|uniref:Uncharacterized protein n=1 Tax=Citrus sinensis TaxID=2711 RepID=A0A067E6P9_CITSI|nr:hypothetical protein CISIN_1g0254382mg [Citrus sinensis]